MNEIYDIISSKCDVATATQKNANVIPHPTVPRQLPALDQTCCQSPFDSDLLTMAQMQQSDQTFSAVSIMSMIV